MQRHIFILLLTSFWVFRADAQDPMFSQMSTSKSWTNPAYHSLTEDPLSFNIKFKELGGSVIGQLPLRTYMADVNFSFPNLDSDRFSLGFSVLSDKGGEGHFGSTLGYLQGAYLKQLSGRYSKIGDHYLSFGAQVGGGQRSTSWDKFWFGRQFDKSLGIVDRSINNGESEISNFGQGTSGMYLDINGGLTYYGNLNDNVSFISGLSVYHLNRPDVSMLQDSKERLSRRFNFHAGMAYGFANILVAKPNIYYIHQGKSNQLLFGGDMQIDNYDVEEFSFSLGLYSRVVSNINGFGFESLLVQSNMQYKSLIFGFGYDITTSGLSQFNNRRGGWEFNLGYALSGGDKTGFHRKSKKFYY